MPNKKVGIFVRVNKNGKQSTLKAEWIGNARLKPVPGGVYWLKWLQGTQQKYRRAGSDPNDAVAAQLRQERILAGENLPGEAEKPNRQRLSDAVELFLLEKPDPRSKARWRWDLDQFAAVCGKTYLDEIDRGDIFKWMAHFQGKGSSPRTVYNRTSSIGTFLKRFGLKLAFTFSTRKKGGDIPNYVDPAPDYYSKDELEKFFAACNPEEKVRYMFFCSPAAASVRSLMRAGVIFGLHPNRSRARIQSRRYMWCSRNATWDFLPRPPKLEMYRSTIN